VGKHQYNALLDTGCERSVVGKRLLPSGVELSPPTSDLYAANRTKIPLIGCTTINFTVHGKEYSADLAVTNSVDELILGIDWLMKNAAQWDFERGRIFLGGEWITLQQHITADRVRRVYAMDTIRIPPLSQADVPVSVTWPTLHPTQSDWLVQPKAVGGGLIVARTLVSEEALNTSIRVINVTDQEYTIYCDDELGKACQATVTLETVEERPEQEAKTAASAGEAKAQCMAISEETDGSHLDCLLNQLGDNLSAQQKETVTQFIRKNADVFSASEFDLGCTGLLEHSIELNSNKPVRQALRRHPVAYLPLIDDCVDSMVENGIVEPMPGSEWMANIVLVRKKDGNLRYCVDYRGLNAMTQKRNYPLPCIDTCLESLGNNSLYSSLDMRSGYWQVPVREEDREKTCFVTRKGVFGFKVLPFGLCNAPSTFQRLVDMTLAGLTWEICLCYLDDLIIFICPIAIA